MYKLIYFPVTGDILTPGHIKCLQALKTKGKVIIGVLTDKALKGYKTAIMPFPDRFFIFQTLARGMGIRVIPQHALNPKRNLKRHKCTHIASGDGWEQSELHAISELGVKPLNIKLRGEKTKLYASSNYKRSLGGET